MMFDDEFKYWQAVTKGKHNFFIGFVKGDDVFEIRRKAKILKAYPLGDVIKIRKHLPSKRKSKERILR